jgi:integrase/recombinase XerD
MSFCATLYPVSPRESVTYRLQRGDGGSNPTTRPKLNPLNTTTSTDGFKLRTKLRTQLEPRSRHHPDCEHRAKGGSYLLCDCPKLAYGFFAGRSRYRLALNTGSLTRAIELIQELENAQEEDLAKIAAPRLPTVSESVCAYLDDCRIRSLRDGTIRSRMILLRHLEQFGATGCPVGGGGLDAITPSLLDAFRRHRSGRNGEPVRPATARKELEYLRSFFRFCISRKWTAENPALALKPPRATAIPTQAFTDEEVTDLLAAAWRLNNHNSLGLDRARRRAYALQLLLLYSGLRISDAVRLKRAALDPRTGYLTLRALKNNVPVKVKLPADCLAALDAIPKESFYFFHSGNAAMKTTEDSLRRTLAALGRMTKIHCHPHRYRDTFAVNLLTSGADLRTVQLLLGHQSIKVTEKHYAHFVAAQQALLDSATARLKFAERPAGTALVHPIQDALGNS